MKCVNDSEVAWEGSCDWEGPVATLNAHMDLCEFLPVSCPRRCGFKPRRKNLTEHLKKYCPYRAWECELCKEPGLYSFAASHLKVCPLTVIKCPSTGCPEEMQRRLVVKHLSTCDYDVVFCKYRSIGCNATLKRMDVPRHDVENEVSHLRMAMDIIVELKNSNKSLECVHIPLVEIVAALDGKYNAIVDLFTEVNEATGNATRALEYVIDLGNYGTSTLAEHIKAMVFSVYQAYTFRITGCQRYFESEQVFTSDPFYTKPGHQSYHMVIHVQLKGGANAACVSVHAALVDGTFDQDLSWPFVGDIYVMLLNQRSTCRHMCKMVKVEAGDNMRVGSSSQVCADFITHEDLLRDPGDESESPGEASQDAATNSAPNIMVQFLKDDTLYFRVVISQFNGWLSCSK